MVNHVMRAQPAIPAKLKLETMQDMVKDAVHDEAQEYAGGDAQHVMGLYELRGHVPESAENCGHHEPWHRDQDLGRLVMDHVSGMRGRASFMINPSVEGIFDERPGNQPRQESESHQPGPAAQNEYFPEDEKDNGQRIADKSEPVIGRSQAELGETLRAKVSQRRSEVVKCDLYELHSSDSKTQTDRSNAGKDFRGAMISEAFAGHDNFSAARRGFL